MTPFFLNEAGGGVGLYRVDRSYYGKDHEAVWISVEGIGVALVYDRFALGYLQHESVSVEKPAPQDFHYRTPGVEIAGGEEAVAWARQGFLQSLLTNHEDSRPLQKDFYVNPNQTVGDRQPSD